MEPSEDFTDVSYEEFDEELQISFGYYDELEDEGKGDGLEFPQSFEIDDPNECDNARDSKTRAWSAPMTPEDEQAAEDYLRALAARRRRRTCIRILLRYGYWVCPGRPTLRELPRPHRPQIGNTAKRKAFDELGGLDGARALVRQFKDELRTALACESKPCQAGALCEFHSRTVSGRGIDWKGKTTFYDIQVYANCSCGEGVTA